VKYLATPHLLKRGENDSFMERGLADRYRITVEGYTRIADALFGHDSEEARQIRRAVRAEHNLKALLDARLMASRRGDRADVALLDRLVETLYVDGGLGVRVGRAVYRHAPVPLLALAKPAYQALLAARRRLARVTSAGRDGGATPTG
jgi:abequosyltransferase